jgi:acetyl esterase/lipase
MKFARVARRLIALIIFACLLQPQFFSARGDALPPAQESSVRGAGHVDRNIIFGMFSGLAFLMDVYHPEKPNGYGAILILGSAWAAPLEYSARPLKNDAAELSTFVLPLVKGGYTVFVIDHRAAPRFHYPAMIEDAHRAVRFIRFSAEQYGINPNRIAAVGYSSGAHLASLLGLMDGAGDGNSRDPVERESGRVQCVVAGGTPADLAGIGETPQALALLSAFVGEPVSANPSVNSALHKKLEDASPIHYVKAGAPPFLLFHGDADELVPYSSSQELEEALSKVHVPVKLITIRGGTHNSVVSLESDEFTGEMVAWLDEHLKQTGGRK